MVISVYADTQRITPDRIRNGVNEHEAYLWIGNHRLAVPAAMTDEELAQSALALRALAAAATQAAGDVEAMLQRRRQQREAQLAAHEPTTLGEDPAPDLGDREAAFQRYVQATSGEA